MKRVVICLAALALALAPSARAVSTVGEWPLSDMAVLDSSAPSATSDPAAETASVSLSSSGSERRLVARLPADLFEMDTNRLERAELSMTFKAASWSASRPLVLHALTNAYDPSSVCWSNRAAGEPWRRDGGDPVDRYCVTAAVASVTSGVWRATWNIRPMLWRSNTCHCLAANGLLVRMGGSKPSSGTVAAPFATAADAVDAALRPEVYAVWQDEFLVTHDYAISGISNGPFHKEYATNATDETVWWEQDITTVGRVMLNTNGFESRAILCMPRELREIDPDRIQKIEGHFEAYINTWSGERISMHPVTSPTRLEMAGNRPLNGANPVHGPSWRWADGPVDTNDVAYPRLAWNTPGGDFDETIGADARLVKLSQYVDSALFDLTPMWRDSAARALLLANGAIVKADRATWSGTNLCAVQIYCSDGYTQTYKGADSSFRITLYPSVGGTGATNALPAFFYLDAASPAWQSLGTTRIWILLNQDRAKGDTHGLLRLPDDFALRDPATLEAAELRFKSEYNDTTYAPILLHPLQEPFGWRNLRESANWTNAYNGSGTTVPWTIPGGAFSATCTTGTYSPGTLDLAFDLMPLLSDPVEAARAATNGLLMRIDPAWTNFDQKTFARYNIDRDSAELVLRDRPLTFSILRSDAPDTPERATDILPLFLAADGTETRIAVRFGESTFAQDTRRVCTVRIFLTSDTLLPANCELRLYPLATSVRLAETTWTRATSSSPWTSHGGDTLDRYITATPSTGATGCCLDLAPLLADPDTASALRANGGLLRLVPTPAVAAARDATPSSVTWTAAGPEAETASARPSSMTVPAPTEIASIQHTGDEVSLDAIGLDPSLDYTVETTPTLSPAVWSNAAPLPRSGTLTIPSPSSSSAFFRLRPSSP